MDIYHGGLDKSTSRHNSLLQLSSPLSNKIRKKMFLFEKMRKIDTITLIRVDLGWTKYKRFKSDGDSGLVSPPIESKKMDSKQPNSK